MTCRSSYAMIYLRQSYYDNRGNKKGGLGGACLSGSAGGERRCKEVGLRVYRYPLNNLNTLYKEGEGSSVHAGKMISSDVIRGYNDTIILYLLQREPSYGYEISKEIRQISEEKYIIKETTLYSAFTRMEKNGYIESFFGNETGGKRRTYYQITDAGLDYYKQKCEEWAVTKEVIDKFVI